MSILFIIIAIAFTVTTTILMIRPFSASRQQQLSFELLDEEERKIEALVSRKVALVQALRDIEYDWETNKISQEDYLRFKKSCERQAVGVMRRLDALHGGEHDWDAVIDQALQERLEESTPAQPTGDDVAPPSAEADGPSGCRSCGAALDSDDQFCSQCGTSVDDSTNPSVSASTTDELDNFSASSPASEVAG